MAWNDVRYMWWYLIVFTSLPLLVFSKICLFFYEICFSQFTLAMIALVIEIHYCLTLWSMFTFYVVLRWNKKLEKFPGKVAKVGNFGAVRSPGPDEKLRTARVRAISQSRAEKGRVRIGALASRIVGFSCKLNEVQYWKSSSLYTPPKVFICCLGFSDLTVGLLEQPSFVIHKIGTSIIIWRS